MKSPSFTLGIEEEYQTVDPVTKELRSHVHAELLSKSKARMEDAVKAEMHDAASTRALVDEINAVESAFRERFPQTQWVFFEPDVR